MITNTLSKLAAKNNCRVMVTEDGMIEVFPLKPMHSFSGDEHSLVCEDSADAIQRLRSDSALPCDCQECKEGVTTSKEQK